MRITYGEKSLWIKENSSKAYSSTGERKYCQCSLFVEEVTNQIQKGLLRIIISIYSTQPDGKENLCVSAEVSFCTCSTLQTDRLKSKSSVTTLAWPNLTVPLGQHLKAGLNQSFLRGMKGGEKVTHAVVSAHSLWQQQEYESTLRLLQHLGVALSCDFVWLLGRGQKTDPKSTGNMGGFCK